MRKLGLIIIGMVLTLVILCVAGIAYLRQSGLDSRPQPGVVEATVSRIARRIAIPASVKAMRNPVPASPEVLTDGVRHFADHCASCHGNDGAGDTELGRGFYPKAPDMRLAATQGLSDGELFYVIEHGVRFTGMPAWGTGTPAGEESTWRLVWFLRHLPELSAEEIGTMQALNPRAPDDIRQELEEERFLNGGVQ